MSESVTVVWKGRPLELRVGETVHLAPGEPYKVEFNAQCGGIVVSPIKRPAGSRRKTRG